MSRHRRSLVAALPRCSLLVSALAAFLLSAQSVIAAPAPFESYRATCPGYDETRITAPGDGVFAPAFIEDTNQLLIPYFVSYSVVGDGTVTTSHFEKAAPLPNDAITCTFSFRFRVGDELMTMTGEVTGVVRGQPS